LFRALVALRRLAYALGLKQRWRASVPVIVIGNLTVGGSGKTPLVIHVAELLVSRGWSPAIVSRGYGGAVEAPRAVTLASEPLDVGDEPVLMARRSGCPVWVGPERARVVETLLRETPRCDVVILDDGLQHYALARDLEVCVVDARGFGNGFMLPAGPLREPRPNLQAGLHR
jgi:tetraacyldisaccharide 4'-kinase